MNYKLSKIVESLNTLNMEILYDPGNMKEVAISSITTVSEKYNDSLTIIASKNDLNACISQTYEAHANAILIIFALSEDDKCKCVEICKKWNLPLLYLEHQHAGMILSNLLREVSKKFMDFRRTHSLFSALISTDSNLESTLEFLKDIIVSEVVIIRRDHKIMQTSKSDLHRVKPTRFKDRINNLAYSNLMTTEVLVSSAESTESSSCTKAYLGNFYSHDYYLLILDDISLNMTSINYLEIALPFISQAFRSELKIAEIKKHHRTEMIDRVIQRILTKDNLSPVAIKTLAKTANWKITQSLIPICIELTYEKLESYVYVQTIRKSLELLFPEIIHSCIEDTTLMILFPSDQLDMGYAIKIAKKVKKHIQSHYSEMSVNIGIGSEINEITYIREKLYEAKEAMTFSKLLPSESSIVHYGSLGVNRYLCLCNSVSELEKLIPYQLLKLRQYDTQKNTQLLETLKVYFKHNCNSNQVAKELFIHYKTVSYRINRIKDIMEVDIKDSMHRLNIEMGLKIMTLTDKQ